MPRYAMVKRLDSAKRRFEEPIIMERIPALRLWIEGKAAVSCFADSKEEVLRLWWERERKYRS